MKDPYTIPRTQTLKNKFGLKSPELLAEAEAKMSGLRMLMLQTRPQPKTFDFQRLKDIHAFIFQDVYDWAGHTRNVNISKGEMFCPAHNIEAYAKDVFKNFEHGCRNAPTKKDFCKVLADNYGNMNALHPFREGNGRAQREFIRELCEDCGYILDLRQTNQSEMRIASRKALYGMPDDLVAIFERNVYTPDEYKNLKQSDKHPFVTLSADDAPKKH